MLSKFFNRSPSFVMYKGDFVKVSDHILKPRGFNSYQLNGDFSSICFCEEKPKESEKYKLYVLYENNKITCYLNGSSFKVDDQEVFNNFKENLEKDQEKSLRFIEQYARKRAYKNQVDLDLNGRTRFFDENDTDIIDELKNMDKLETFAYSQGGFDGRVFTQTYVLLNEKYSDFMLHANNLPPQDTFKASLSFCYRDKNKKLCAFSVDFSNPTGKESWISLAIIKNVAEAPEKREITFISSRNLLDSHSLENNKEILQKDLYNIKNFPAEIEDIIGSKKVWDFIFDLFSSNDTNYFFKTIKELSLKIEKFTKEFYKNRNNSLQYNKIQDNKKTELGKEMDFWSIQEEILKDIKGKEQENERTKKINLLKEKIDKLTFSIKLPDAPDVPDVQSDHPGAFLENQPTFNKQPPQKSNLLQRYEKTSPGVRIALGIVLALSVVGLFVLLGMGIAISRAKKAYYNAKQEYKNCESIFKSELSNFEEKKKTHENNVEKYEHNRRRLLAYNMLKSEYQTSQEIFSKLKNEVRDYKAKEISYYERVKNILEQTEKFFSSFLEKYNKLDKEKDMQIYKERFNEYKSYLENNSLSKGTQHITQEIEKSLEEVHNIIIENNMPENSINKNDKIEQNIIKFN